MNVLSNMGVFAANIAEEKIEVILKVKMKAAILIVNMRVNLRVKKWKKKSKKNYNFYSFLVKKINKKCSIFRIYIFFIFFFNLKKK